METLKTTYDMNDMYKTVQMEVTLQNRGIVRLWMVRVLLKLANLISPIQISQVKIQENVRP